MSADGNLLTAAASVEQDKCRKPGYRRCRLAGLMEAEASRPPRSEKMVLACLARARPAPIACGALALSRRNPR